MNSFFKTFLASLLAIMVSFGVVVVLGFFFTAVLVGSMLSSKSVTVDVKPNTILKIDFLTPIVESSSDNPLDNFDVMSMQFQPSVTGYDVVKSIHIATIDPSIVGIYLDLVNPPMVDIANLDEIRNALVEFKASGKKIYSYADVYSQKSYYLSSVSDSIYLCPVGDVQWMGLSNGNTYYKGALDKLGVNVEVFKYGKYKSAVEPFLLSGMSDASREQTTRMVDNIWNKIVSTVSESRNIDVAKLQTYASELTLKTAEDAKNAGLVDKILYKEEVEKSMKENATIVSFNQYLENNKLTELIVGDGSQKNQIAVIYANGEIVSGKSQPGVIGDASLTKKIDAAANDNNIKAIVLRVNSPGGSALASDIIDRAVRRAKSRKPIVVSMGAYAASGGYYISSNSDAIVASPFTLTGSIGVFGIMVEASDAIKKHLGVTFDIVKTNPYADMGTPYRKMTDSERVHFQAGVDRVYETFVNCVSDGRQMSFQSIDSIAQGRVWTTADALNNGLVDNVGGLLDAIYLAADKADIRDNFVVKNTNLSNDFLTTLFAAVNSESVQILKNKLIDSKLSPIGILSKELKSLELLLQGDKIQAITPLYFNF